MTKYSIELVCIAHIEIEANSKEEALELFGEGRHAFQISGSYLESKQTIPVELDHIENIEEIKDSPPTEHRG